MRCLCAVCDIPADSTANPALQIERRSAALLGKAYRLDPLGEGVGSAIDPDPRWSLDFFDCLSLVETVLALQFGARNHFMEADWLPQNLARGVLVDVTGAMPAPQALASGVITRRQWLKNCRPIRCSPTTASCGTPRQAPTELRRLAAQLPESETVSLSYARLRELASPALARSARSPKFRIWVLCCIEMASWCFGMPVAAGCGAV